MFKEIFSKDNSKMLQETGAALKDEKKLVLFLKPVGLFFLASFIESFILSILIGVMDGLGIKGDLYSVIYYIACLLITFIPITVFVVAAKKEKRTSTSLGFNKEHQVSGYLKGLLVGTLLILGVFFTLYFLGMIKVKYSGIPIIVFVLTLIGYLIQGAEEEIIVRGYFMNSLTSKYSVAASLIISSLVFAAMHLGNDSMSILSFVNLTLFGIMLGLYVLRSKNLYGACAFHTIWNFIQGIVVGVEVSGTSIPTVLFKTTQIKKYTLMNGGSFGFEGGLICTIGVTIVILLLLFLPKKNKQEA